MFARLLSALLLGLLAGLTSAADVLPWMRAEWSSEAPFLQELGLEPKTLAQQLGNDQVLVLAHPLRDITIPGVNGPRTFKQVRFSSAIARVDLPAAELKEALFDLNRVKEFNKLITHSEVVTRDGRNYVARYRINVPLPVFSIKVDFRAKHILDGDSMSAIIIDGEVNSVLAVLGGFNESLANQPGLARTEVIALDAKRSLVVTTGWGRLEPTSWLVKLALKQYPEIQVVAPYVGVATISEAVRRRFNPESRRIMDGEIPAYDSLVSLQPLFERFSQHGYVSLMHPAAPPAAIKGAQPSMRFVSTAGRLNLPIAQAPALSTQFERWPEPFPELRKIKVKEQPKATDLDMKVRVGLSILTVPFDVQTRNVWETPRRLEFFRLKGDFQRLEGGGEWRPLANNDSLLFISSGFILGDNVHWMVRMAHDIVKDVPFIDELATMAVQMGLLTRFTPWVEQQAGRRVAQKS